MSRCPAPRLTLYQCAAGHVFQHAETDEDCPACAGNVPLARLEVGPRWLVEELARARALAREVVEVQERVPA